MENNKIETVFLSINEMFIDFVRFFIVGLQFSWEIIVLEDYDSICTRTGKNEITLSFNFNLCSIHLGTNLSTTLRGLATSVGDVLNFSFTTFPCIREVCSSWITNFSKSKNSSSLKYLRRESPMVAFKDFFKFCSIEQKNRSSSMQTATYLRT